MRTVKYIQKKVTELHRIQITLTPDRLIFKGDFEVELIQQATKVIENLLINKVVDKSWRGLYAINDDKIVLYNNNKSEILTYEFSEYTEDRESSETP